ncbi:hypothetical protein [Marinitoga sp. 38H-ov]|uniref:hypothetical protein n=1 Tax=Marinitoga sp. 38H-ov TaxID=1755814 RepID=UPI0013EB70A2|nr:hypothetical protein [Marinitoga sp. 38H-ov]KAF2956601.1 hypothetical protein AS160_05230 [Marinitoga sp. 38H-ov]
MSKISMRGLINIFSIIFLSLSIFLSIYFIDISMDDSYFNPISENIITGLNEKGKYISLYFESEIDRLKLLPKNFSYSATDTGEILQVLKDQLKKYPEFEEFFVANSDGESISSSNIFTNISRYRYFKEIFTDNKEWAISDIFTSKISGDTSIILAVSYYYGNNKYIFGGALNLKNLFLENNSFKFNEVGEIFYIDNLGSYFGVNNDGTINSGTIAKNFRDSIIRNSDKTKEYLEIKFNKKNYYVFLSSIDFIDWKIGFFIEKSYIFPSFIRYYIYGILYLIIIIIISVIVNYSIFKKRLIIPLDKMKFELKKFNELRFKEVNIEIKEPLLIDISDNLQLTAMNLRESFNNFSSKLYTLEDNIQKTEILINEEINRINEENDTMEKLSKTFEAITKSVNDSQNLSENFKNKLNLYDSELEKLRHSVIKSKSKISFLNEITSKVTDISEKVSDLSFRAEILSLNAALEASKENGNLSFAVIASDMRDMSYVLKDYNIKTASQVKHITENLDEYKDDLDELFKTIDLNISEIRKVTSNYQDLENFIKEYSISSTQVKNALNILKLIINKNKSIMDNIVENFSEIKKNYEDLKKIFISKKSPKNLEEIFKKLDELESKDENIGSESNEESF